MGMESNTTLEAIQYNGDDGSLTFNKIRYMLIRLETIVEIQKPSRLNLDLKWHPKYFIKVGLKGLLLR